MSDMAERPEDSNLEALDFERLFTELKEYADKEGIGLDAKLERAAVHYQSDEPKSRTEPLSEEEVKALADADDELLGSIEDELPLSCKKGDLPCSENTGR